MMNSNAPAPATPAASAPAPAAKPDAKPTAGIAPDSNAPPAGTPPETKPTDPLEAELSAKYGDQWANLPEAIRTQVLAAERKGRDADKKYQMVAKLQKDHDLTQKQAAQLLDGLVNDPAGIFSNPAIMKRLNRGKLREFAEKIVWDGIQEERMDPKDREIRDLRAFKEEQDRARKEHEDGERSAAEKARMDAQVKQRREFWEREIIGALQAEGIEADNAFVAQVARYIQAARRAGKPVEMPRIISQVKSDFASWQNRYLLSGFKPRQEGESNETFLERYEKFISRVDPAIVEAIRTGDTAKLKKTARGSAPAPRGESRRSDPNKKMSMSEWLDRREDRLRGE